MSHLKTTRKHFTFRVVFFVIIAFVFSSHFCDPSRLTAQWGPALKIPKHTNQETNENILRRLNDIETVVAGADQQQRRKLIPRLIYAQAAMDDPDGVVANLERYRDELSQNDQLQYYCCAIGDFARAGQFLDAWSFVEIVDELNLKGNSVHSNATSIPTIIRHMIRQGDIETAIQRMGSELPLDNERFNWSDGNTRGKQKLWQEIVKHLGRRNRVQEAEQLIESHFSGTSTRDHLLWDLAVSCKKHGYKKSAAVIEKIADPKIAGQVLARMINRPLEFDQWAPLFHLQVRVRGPKLALASFRPDTYRFKTDVMQFLPVVTGVYEKIAPEKRTNEQRTKMFKLRLLAGEIELAFQSFETNRDPAIVDRLIDEPLRSIAMQWGAMRDSRTDHFVKAIEYVRPGKLRNILYFVYFHKLFNTQLNQLERRQRLITAAFIADDYYNAALGLKETSDQSQAVQNLLKIDRVDLAERLCHACGKWHWLVEYHLERDELELALQVVSKPGSNSGSDTESETKSETKHNTELNTGSLIVSLVSFIQHDHFQDAERLFHERFPQVGTKNRTEVGRQTFLILISKGMGDAAIKWVERKLVQIDPASWPSFEQEVMSEFEYPYEQQTNPENLKRILAWMTDKDRANRVLAKRFAKEGDVDAAIETFQKVAAADQDNWYLHLESLLPYIESERALIDLISDLSDKHDWDESRLLERILEYHVGVLLEAHEDQRVVDLIDLLETPGCRTKVLTTIAWGLNNRSKGNAINY